MPKEFQLEIISPEGSLFNGSVSEINLPTASGQLTILADHEPIFTKLAEGELIFSSGSEKLFIAITGGFLEISGNKVNVLADYAVRSSEIVANQAEAAMKAAEEALKNKKDRLAVLLADKQLKKSSMELKVAEKMRKHPRKQQI